MSPMCSSGCLSFVDVGLGPIEIYFRSEQQLENSHDTPGRFQITLSHYFIRIYANSALNMFTVQLGLDFFCV